MTYMPWGALATLENPNVPGWTPVQETYTYNNRLQPAMIQLGVYSGNLSLLACTVYYYSTAAWTPPSACPAASTLSSPGAGDNGNVMDSIFLDNNPSSTPFGSHTIVYTYDALNRLKSAAASDLRPALWWVQDYSGTDQFGNMTGGGTANGTAMTFDQTTNRMTAYGGAALSYDAAGNVVYDVTGVSPHTYQWNAEDKMVSADGNGTSQCASGSTACYVYNALGQRVEMDAGGGKTEYLFDASGEELETCDGMMDSGGRCWLNSYVKLGGRTLANYTYTDSLFTHPDNIGSTGIVTNYTGAVDDIDLYYPFGAYWVSWKQSYDDLRFAGFQEMESPFSPNLYPTNTRKYNPDLGRWLTPDPAGKKAVTLTDPQTWNMYAYVRNNPTTLNDPTGLYELNPSNCGDNGKCQKKYDKAAAKFETRREKDLNSKKDAVREAAAAYGAKGEANGVHVAFANLSGQHINGKVDPFASTPGNVNIQVTLDFGRAGSAETQTHEGTHVADDLAFLNSYSRNTGTYDQNESATHGQQEFDAFRAGAEVNHEHGFGPNDTQKIWDYIRANYPADLLSKPVFDPRDFPTGPND